jgi:hypothetical protein
MIASSFLLTAIHYHFRFELFNNIAIDRGYLFNDLRRYKVPPFPIAATKLAT